MAECIQCGFNVNVQSPEVGEIVDCPDCGTELEVTAAAPLAFSAAPQEQEDWGE